MAVPAYERPWEVYAPGSLWCHRFESRWFVIYWPEGGFEAKYTVRLFTSSGLVLNWNFQDKQPAMLFANLAINTGALPRPADVIFKHEITGTNLLNEEEKWWCQR